MKLRCDLHLNGGARKLVLVPALNETGEHLALKLASYLLFWDCQPVVEASSRHPALAGQEFVPDLMALDDSGQVRLWVECGQVTMHKLKKLTRRLPAARIVVVKATEREAARLRGDLKDRLERQERIEVLGLPGTKFKEWLGCLRERTEIYGESGGLTINAVVNEHPLVAEFGKF